MSQEFEQIEKTVGKMQYVSPDDLGGLAALHDVFIMFCKQFGELSDVSEVLKANVQKACVSTRELIEKIILHEVDDENASCNQIADMIASMNGLLEQLKKGDSSMTTLPEIKAGDQPRKSAHLNSTPVCKPQISLPDNVDEDIFMEFLSNLPYTLTGLEQAVLSYEKDREQDAVDNIKAILHNLKGESALMGLEDIATFCHETETLIEDSIEFPVERLLDAKDWLQNEVLHLSEKASAEEQPENTEVTDSAVEVEAAVEEEQEEEAIRIAENDVPLVHDFINESNEHLENAEVNLLNLEDNPEDPETINAIFRAFHTIKGVAGFLNLKQIGSLAHATENLLDLSRKGSLALEGQNVDVVFEAIDVMKQLLGSLSEAVENNQSLQPYKQLNVLIEKIKCCANNEEIEKRVGEILVEEGAVDRKTVRDTLKEQKETTPEKRVGEILVDHEKVSSDQVKKALETQKTQKESIAQKKETKRVVGESTVKVATERLDSLINMVGELVIAQSMVSQDILDNINTNQKLARNERHLKKITRELQDLSMSLRMVPVQGVFQKMARLVRDLSRKSGKEISFSMSGAETELDRNVVEAIADPLVHMVRNSIDHGVEKPEDRIKAGKSAVGTINLRAYHQGGNIVIEIEDDGRGLNREKILKKAIDNGLIKDGIDMSDQDVYRLIFSAGLSTAEKITDISGRGVGMDVVRKNIEALRGRIDIDSTPGEGSVFSIRLPLTLAVIDGQIVTVGNENFIIPIISVEQNLRPTREQISTVQDGRGEMIKVRESLLPLIRLHDLFSIEPQSTDPCESLIVVVTDGNRRCCLLVDDLLGQQQVVIKSLGDYLGAIRGVSGGAVMGDGNVSLIIDVPGLLLLTMENSNQGALIGV